MTSVGRPSSARGRTWCAQASICPVAGKARCPLRLSHRRCRLRFSTSRPSSSFPRCGCRSSPESGCCTRCPISMARAARRSPWSCTSARLSSIFTIGPNSSGGLLRHTVCFKWANRIASSSYPLGPIPPRRTALSQPSSDHTNCVWSARPSEFPSFCRRVPGGMPAVLAHRSPESCCGQPCTAHRIMSVRAALCRGVRG